MKSGGEKAEVVHCAHTLTLGRWDEDSSFEAGHRQLKGTEHTLGYNKAEELDRGEVRGGKPDTLQTEKSTPC
jgi:hypothetical protein